jgi:hypothetical protein
MQFVAMVAHNFVMTMLNLTLTKLTCLYIDRDNKISLLDTY